MLRRTVMQGGIQIAKTCIIHIGTLGRWMRQARIDDGGQPGLTRTDSDELRCRNRLFEQEVEVQRRVAAYLSQASGKRLYPLVRELAAAGLPGVVMCRVLKLARPLYRWPRAPMTVAELVDAYRANALFDAHREDPGFWHRLLADVARQADERMCDRTAWKITAENGWWSALGKKRDKNWKRPGPAVHDDLCVVLGEHARPRHALTARRPNRLWLTGITQYWTGEGRLDLCVMKDAYSDKIVDY